MYLDREENIIIAANHCVTLRELRKLIKRIMLTWLALSLLFIKHCQFHSTVRQMLIFMLVLTSVYLAKVY